MKLQYLGDARDAFKWDFLHWICTKSLPQFDELVYVPMLTPDIQKSNHGKTLHQKFECKSFIRPFLDSLKNEPRSLARISTLGTIEQNAASFRVSLFVPTKYMVSGKQRAEYWADFEPEKLENSIVFFDPDNGFETSKYNGTSWVRHSELKHIISRLPKTSVAIVYQHRPHRKWSDLFFDLRNNLSYVHTAIAAYEGNLSFLAMASNESAGKRIFSVIKGYADEHPVVCHEMLRGNHG